MVRSVDTFFIDGESFISYCSDSDFDYAIYIGQKCKVLRNEKCFIGTLYKVNSNKNTFSIKQNNGEIIEINCADVEEIFSEEEIGTINNKLFEQGISIFAHDNVNMPLNQKKNTNPNRFKKY